MIVAGIILGLSLSWISVYLNEILIKRMKAIPPRVASRRIFIQHSIKITFLLLILALIIWQLGYQIGIGVILGMFLGIVVYLFVNRNGILNRLPKNKREGQN